MYRQVRVSNDQCHLQCVLWRPSANSPLLTYHLKTITYGTASGAWLAIRTIKQLAKDEGDAFPAAKPLLMDSCYVDDVVASFPSLAAAVEAATELKRLLAMGKFETHKWASNSSSLLSSIGEKECSTQLKVIGVLWCTRDDAFQPKIPPFIPQRQYTKRSVASEIAKIFDPLGLIGPVVQRMKVMLQRLWQMKNIDWDTPLDAENCRIWETFRIGLSTLETLTIPRCICPGLPVRIELHGFSDSSQDGYGACIYARTTSASGDHEIRLIASKGRVAPHKKTSIPRLELLGAVLLVEFMDPVRQALRCNIDRVVYHCDSSTVLAWINRPSAELKLFVGNRIATIHTYTDPSDWRFIRSEDNPADCLSRGATADALIAERLWWHGPDFLAEDEKNWPASGLDRFIESDDPEALSEIKNVHLTLAATSRPSIRPEDSLTHSPSRLSTATVRTVKSCDLSPIKTLPLLEKFSSLPKVLRVAGYCVRYLRILLQRARHSKQKPKIIAREELSGKLEVIHAPTIDEIDTGERLLIGFVQRERFGEEIRRLIHGQPLLKRSHILKLSPFVDDFGLVRVGGRIQRSSASPGQKHQLLLPKNHSLSTLIVHFAHIENCHAAPLLLINTLRQRYWIVHDTSLAKHVYHQCHPCFRARPKTATQVMGWLPAERITATSRPFVHVGVDYAGPLYLTLRLRGRPIMKVWVVVFVCLVTRAVHLDLVFDCTTVGFLAALHRLIARRGRPDLVWSDNSTTFGGAANELQQLLQSSEFNEAMSQECAHLQFEWRFIPPLSPHMGGIWEAAVKSFKCHLKRIAGDERYTMEELLTLLLKIESCLNSCPLSVMSHSPDDLQPLTPGHFLIGQPLNALPERNLLDVNVSRLTRFQAIQQQTQTFWRRWSVDILHTMQQRSKWN